MPPTEYDMQAYLNHLGKGVSLHGGWRHVARLQDSDTAARVPPDLRDGAATFAQDGPNLLGKLHVDRTILRFLALHRSLLSRYQGFDLCLGTSIWFDASSGEPTFLSNKAGWVERHQYIIAGFSNMLTAVWLCISRFPSWIVGTDAQ